MAHDITKDVIGCKEFEGQNINLSGDDLKFNCDIILANMTSGSVPFIDSNLKLSQDNANLFWYTARKELWANLIKITSDGTQAAPALKFNDTNTGFYKSGDSIRTSINNSTIATVDSTGLDMNTHKILNVVDPTANQEAATKKYVDDEIDAKIEDGTAVGQVCFWDGTQWVHTETTELFWDDTNKRLGLREPNPQVAFHITKASGSTAVRLQSDTRILTIQQGDGANNAIFDTNNHFEFKTDGILRLKIEDSLSYFMTNLGVGTTSPDFLTHIEKNTGSGGEGGYPSLRVTNLSTATHSFATVDAQGATVIAKLVADGLGTGGITYSTRGGATGTKSNHPFFIYTNNSPVITALTSGNVGIDTATPTQLFSVKEKACMTAIGGIGIKLTNRTGVNSIKGNTVIAHTTINDAVAAGGISELQVLGVFLESGVSNGSEAWVVVSGIADVHMDANAVVRGDRIVSSATAGLGVANNAPSVAVHFQEIGHCIQSGAANSTVRCVLHPN